MKYCQHYFFFFKKVMSEETETKTRKKTEHTRMYAQLCSSVNTIFTSVVVYSRTSPTTLYTNKTKRFDCSASLVECISVQQRFFNEKREKNGAHTHVRTTVQLKNAIFTSVVVYSRTSPKLQHFYQNWVLLWRSLVIKCCNVASSYFV